MPRLKVKRKPIIDQTITGAERREDALARLLEGDGECTAVVRDEKGLCVAANSIRKLQRREASHAALPMLINDAMQYFRTEAVAARAPLHAPPASAAAYAGTPLYAPPAASAASHAIDTPDLEVMLHICEEAFKSAEKVSRAQTQAFVREIIATPDGQLKSRIEIEGALKLPLQALNNVYGRDEGPAMAGIATRLQDINRDFNNVLKEVRNPETLLSKALNLEWSTLTNGGDGMHAEMRIVDHIYKKRKGDALEQGVMDCMEDVEGSAAGEAALAGSAVGAEEVVAGAEEVVAGTGEGKYIGISKLCCPNCYAVLLAVSDSEANPEILLKFRTRGSHGLDSEGNWKAPEVLENQGIREKYEKHLTPLWPF